MVHFTLKPCNRDFRCSHTFLQIYLQSKNSFWSMLRDGLCSFNIFLLFLDNDVEWCRAFKAKQQCPFCCYMLYVYIYLALSCQAKLLELRHWNFSLRDWTILGWLCCDSLHRYFSNCSRSRDLSGLQECTGVHGRLWEWTRPWFWLERTAELPFRCANLSCSFSLSSSERIST